MDGARDDANRHHYFGRGSKGHRTRCSGPHAVAVLAHGRLWLSTTRLIPVFGWDGTICSQADFSKITPQVFSAAIGQAFFSIGVAMAGLMIFGAYLPPGQSIVRYGFLIIVADTAIALLAGLMIFPLVFRYGLDPAGGVGLIFKVLPIAFGQLPLGALVGGLFFLLLSVAAMTSMVGFVEPLVATLARLTGMSRLKKHLVNGAIFNLSVIGEHFDLQRLV